jgi:hypothetical protein
VDEFNLDELPESSEEDLFMACVAGDEPQLLFLDTYMRETFGKNTEQRAI